MNRINSRINVKIIWYSYLYDISAIFLAIFNILNENALVYEYVHHAAV